MAHNFLSSDPHDVARALQEQNRSMEEKEAQAEAVQQHLPYVNLQSFPIDLNVLGLFTEDEAKNAEGFPFFRDQHELRVATINPANPLLRQKIDELAGKFHITVHFISRSSYQNTLKYYNKVLVPKPAHSDTVRLDEQKDFIGALKNLSAETAQSTLSASDLLADMFGAAVAMEASDIHLEPEQHLVKVRFRIDGVLQDILHLGADLQPKLISRIKVLAKLKLNVEDQPQDGRLTFYRGAQAVDVRVSVLPSGYGESVVMRLLGVGTISLKLEQLGLRGRAYQVVEQELAKPNGMIITTGPTGSGKTTTLYAFLNELNKPGVKIITLEDPIEYKLEGIQQTPIDYRVDFSFAKGLRAVLRQDPDIVMVGEVRDADTAETALQAALTGHVVLSTLHTNDAFGAVPRLTTMGVKPFVIAPAVNAIIAQRLVRRLCQACRQPVELSAEVIARVKKLLQDIPPAAEVTVPSKLTFFHSPGCPQCHNLGYKGRMGIYEVVQVNDQVKDLILQSATSRQLQNQAAQNGTMSMLQDGLLKALEGITDVEEVFRVAGG